MSPENKNFDPMTAREALLEIRRHCQIGGQGAHGSLAVRRFGEIEALADAGLERPQPPNFELTDQLADRLAEAHNILLGLREGYEEAAAKGNDAFSAEFKSKIDEALSLPPDLEAMVERRIGPAQ